MGTYNRVYNFSAGPSMLPVEVLEKVQKDLLNYEGSGQSVMEMSHRSKEYQKIIDDAEADLRELMHIPDNYKVLFVQGGGTLQFAMVPLNLLRNSKKADYVLTGTWAKKAYKEACKYGDIRVVASSEDEVHMGSENHQRRCKRRCGLCVYYNKQYHIRNEIQLHSGNRKCSSCCGYVFQHSVRRD